MSTPKSTHINTFDTHILVHPFIDTNALISNSRVANVAVLIWMCDIPYEKMYHIHRLSRVHMFLIFKGKIYVKCLKNVCYSSAHLEPFFS